jgi:hypothetical protein
MQSGIQQKRAVFKRYCCCITRTSASHLKGDDTAATPDVSGTPSGQDAEAKNFSIAPIVTDYLSLKNALVSDDDKAAASAGKTVSYVEQNGYEIHSCR